MKDENIYQALVAAQAEFTPVVKDRENPYFKSEYATLLAVSAMIRPILARHGLGYVQTFAQSPEPSIVTRIIHASGETIECVCPFACADKKPQGYGSAITYFRRYGLQAALGIVVCDGTDDDGNAANGNEQKPAAPAPKKPSETAPRATPAWDVCPCGKTKGTRWTDIPTETLEMILGFPPDKVPQIKDEHRERIRAELAKRVEQKIQAS